MKTWKEVTSIVTLFSEPSGRDPLEATDCVSIGALKVSRTRRCFERNSAVVEYYETTLENGEETILPAAHQKRRSIKEWKFEIAKFRRASSQRLRSSSHH